MSAKSIGVRTVVIHRFTHLGHGSGANVIEGTVQRAIYETSAFMPQKSSCAAAPIAKVTYRYIEWCGKRYDVKPVAGCDACQITLVGGTPLAPDLDATSYAAADERYTKDTPCDQRKSFDARICAVLLRMGGKVHVRLTEVAA